MPALGALSVWVVTPTGVPLDALDPEIVTEIPVTEPWFATTPPKTSPILQSVNQSYGRFS